MKQVKVGAVISYATLAVNIAATLLYIPWMVSVVGKANYAMYTLANTFVNIFVMDFGMSSSVSKFITRYRAEGNVEKVKEFISTVAKIYLLLDIVILVVLTVLYFFIDVIYTGLTAEEIVTFRRLYLIVASYAVVSFPFMPLSGMMYAYEKLIELKLCELFQKIFSICLVIVALFFRTDVAYVVLANVVSALCSLVIKFIIVEKETHIRIKFSLANMDMFRQIVGFAVWTAVQSLAQRCVFSLAPTILGIVATSDDIAVFSPASAIESYFASVASAINGFFIMRVTKYLVANEKGKLYQLMLKVGRFQILLMCLIFVVFVCVGDDFMCVWMGPDFRVAWLCAAFIMIPDILIFSEQVANTAAIADNLVKQQAFGQIIMAAICVILSFPLSSVYGAIGASIAIAAAYAVLFLYNNVLYQKKMGLDMRRFIKESYGRLMLPISLATAAGYLICQRWIAISGWKGVIIKGVVGVLLYTLAVYRFLTAEERNMIWRLFGKNRGKDGLS